MNMTECYVQSINAFSWIQVTCDTEAGISFDLPRMRAKFTCLHFSSLKDDCVVKFRIFSLFGTDFSSDGVPTGSGGFPETLRGHPRKTGKMVKCKASI